MQVIYLKRFSKDLDKLKSRKTAIALFKVVNEIKNAESINTIPHLEKLSGYKNAYRIRINAFRLGIFIEGSRVELARFLHRKDIYRYFP